jgi:hypothetical protein
MLSTPRTLLRLKDAVRINLPLEPRQEGSPSWRRVLCRIFDLGMQQVRRHSCPKSPLIVIGSHHVLLESEQFRLELPDRFSGAPRVQ